MFPDFRVGDVVTHGDGDEHCVLWTDSDNGTLPTMVEAVCVRSSTNGRYVAGDRERNVVWAFYLVRRAKPRKRKADVEVIRKRA